LIAEAKIMKTAKRSLALSLVLAAAAALPVIAQTVEPQPEPGWIYRETAKDYRQRARYPESSRAILAGEKDPVKEKRTPTRQSLLGPDGSELAVWASAVSVEVAEPIDLFASFDTRGKAAPEESITAEIVNAAGGIVAEVTYKDDGKGADYRASDGIWSARLVLPAGLEPAQAESYMVRTRARLSNGDLREANGGFLVSNPAARLTGRYRDSLREGNLVVAAEVEVREAGRFHLAGTLYDMQGAPIGTAQAAAVLEPGRQWIELSFYGLMFQDRQVAGPYRVGTLALATVNGMPNAFNRLVENAHVTRAYNLRQFNREPFGEKSFLEAAQRLEAEAAIRPLVKLPE
jgi:hypothetical protein